VYDDVVTDKSVTTPEMIEKTTDALGLSYNLGAVGGQVRFIGTRYHFNDTYKTVIDRGTAKPRIYPATVDGTMDSAPVLLSVESLTKKRRDQGPYIFSCQMLQNPKGDETQGFKRQWLKYADAGDGSGMNKYILVDPASEKKKGSDWTVMWAIGLGQDGNYYHLEVIRDRLSLTQRADTIIKLHRKWKPTGVGYEKYGMQADIEHIKTEQQRLNYRFEITELGGQMPKADRIKRLVPKFEQGKFYLKYNEFKTNYEGKSEDLVDVFINNEYLAFPVPLHDDMLDALARILDEDLGIVWPQPEEQQDRYRKKKQSGSPWTS
jgi:phage terminase large subunit-like protein